jgi:hypothetical protein
MDPRRDVRNWSAGRGRQASAASRVNRYQGSLDLASSSDDFWSRPVASVPREGMLICSSPSAIWSPVARYGVPQRRPVA